MSTEEHEKLKNLQIHSNRRCTSETSVNEGQIQQLQKQVEELKAQLAEKDLSSALQMVQPTSGTAF